MFRPSSTRIFGQILGHCALCSCRLRRTGCITRLSHSITTPTLERSSLGGTTCSHPLRGQQRVPTHGHRGRDLSNWGEDAQSGDDREDLGRANALPVSGTDGQEVTVHPLGRVGPHGIAHQSWATKEESMPDSLQGERRRRLMVSGPDARTVQAKSSTHDPCRINGVTQRVIDSTPP